MSIDEHEPDMDSDDIDVSEFTGAGSRILADKLWSKLVLFVVLLVGAVGFAWLAAGAFDDEDTASSMRERAEARAGYFAEAIEKDMTPATIIESQDISDFTPLTARYTYFYPHDVARRASNLNERCLKQVEHLNYREQHRQCGYVEVENDPQAALARETEEAEMRAAEESSHWWFGIGYTLASLLFLLGAAVTFRKAWPHLRQRGGSKMKSSMNAIKNSSDQVRSRVADGRTRRDAVEALRNAHRLRSAGVIEEEEFVTRKDEALEDLAAIETKDDEFLLELAELVEDGVITPEDIRRVQDA